MNSAHIMALTRRTAVPLGALLLIGVPLLIDDIYFIGIMVLCLLFAALAASWNLLAGYSGIFSFGHQALFGAGAYCSAMIASRGISPWISIWMAAAVALGIGVVATLPVLRLGAAPYIAIVTLAFGEVIRLLALNLRDLTGGAVGFYSIPELPGPKLPLLGKVTFTQTEPQAFYYLALVLFALITIGTAILMRSPHGLALKAIRESSTAAESLGVHVTKYKILIMMLASFLAGLIGALYAHYLTIITPNSTAALSVMVQIAAITIVGGMGTLYGPLFGSLLVVVGLEQLRVVQDYRIMIYGGLLVLVVMLLPDGIAGKWRREERKASRFARVRRSIATRSRIAKEADHVG